MNATPPERTPSTYAAAGVDEEREQAAFARVMRPWLARTRVRSPLVTSITGLASGYFATLMHLPPGPPLALTTDGVGTKILLAREANRWAPNSPASPSRAARSPRSARCSPTRPAAARCSTWWAPRSVRSRRWREAGGRRWTAAPSSRATW